MNPTAVPPTGRRHVWRWVFVGIALCLLPVICVGILVASALSLSREAALLRNHVMSSTDTDWHRKIQLSVGSMTLTALRTGMAFAHGKEVEDVRLALASVRKASVGVYERSGRKGTWSNADLFADADKAMGRRGWTRLVGVHDHSDTVLIYVPEDAGSGDTMDICLAVVSDGQMVVVSTSVNADALARLVARHGGDFPGGRLHLAKLRL
ncbi:MAG TPA: hypothetical protein VL200_02130 [Lacunisphaera sp.]|jgi:hypothetical protein|nr:hypothetical protein [Lacunisphaera sp.]